MGERRFSESAAATPSRTRRTSLASEPIPSPNRPTFVAALVRPLPTFFAVLAFGIGTPRTFLRDLRAVSAAPLARPATPAPTASAGTAAFFAISPRLVPLFERDRELLAVDLRVVVALVPPFERDFGLRLLVGLRRLVVDRVLDALAPLPLRPFLDLVAEFELARLRVVELFVCWAMWPPFLPKRVERLLNRTTPRSPR